MNKDHERCGLIRFGFPQIENVALRNSVLLIFEVGFSQFSLATVTLRRRLSFLSRGLAALVIGFFFRRQLLALLHASVQFAHPLHVDRRLGRVCPRRGGQASEGGEKSAEGEDRFHEVWSDGASTRRRDYLHDAAEAAVGIA